MTADEMGRKMFDAVKGYIAKYVETKIAPRMDEAEELIRSLNRRVKALEDERAKR